MSGTKKTVDQNERNLIMKIIKLVPYLCAAAFVFTAGFAYANSTIELDAGNAQWKGGVSSGEVYSKIIDQKVDGYRYYAKVWAKDDRGNTSYYTGYTFAKGEKGAVKVTRDATYFNPFVANTCGYNSFRKEKA
jgi:hypothetical protein